MSTRGRTYQKSATEQALQLREAATARSYGRLRDRTAVAGHLQHAEEKIDNSVFGVEYNPGMLRMMLMAFRDDYGVVEALCVCFSPAAGHAHCSHHLRANVSHPLYELLET